MDEFDKDSGNVRSEFRRLREFANDSGIVRSEYRRLRLDGAGSVSVDEEPAAPPVFPF